MEVQESKLAIMFYEFFLQVNLSNNFKDRDLLSYTKESENAPKFAP